MTKHVRRSSKRSGKQPGFNYAVGYKRPPVATRFRAGGVGNKKGRPKKQKTVGQIIEEGLTTRMRIKKKGRSETKTALEHIIENLIEAAACGDMRAINASFALLHRYRDSPETTLKMAELAQQDKELLAMYGPVPPENDGGFESNSSTSEANNDKATDSEPNAEPSSKLSHSDGDEL
jgi:hypothetical protein